MPSDWIPRKFYKTKYPLSLYKSEYWGSWRHFLVSIPASSLIYMAKVDCSLTSLYIVIFQDTAGVVMCQANDLEEMAEESSANV